MQYGDTLPLHTLKAYGGTRHIAPFILPCALDGVERLTSHLGRFSLEQESRNPANRSRLVSRADLDALEKIKLSFLYRRNSNPGPPSS